MKSLSGGELFRRLNSNERKEVVAFVSSHHYSGKCPNYIAAFGSFDENGDMVGVCCFGHPASPFVSVSICGERNRALELNRVAFCRRIPNAVTQLVSYSLRMIKWDGYVVSYADTAQGHYGIIYQALSWSYGGVSKARTDIDAGGKHPRHHLGIRENRVVRSAKHRYWTAIGPNAKRLKAQSKWDRLPYPKP